MTTAEVSAVVMIVAVDVDSATEAKADVIVVVVASGLKADDEVLDGSAAELVENI
jgi:hypothetical protein